jgi:hypothetical protein
MMRAVSVYLFGGRVLLISPESVTPVGVNVEQGPLRVLEAKVSDRELGAAIASALQDAGRLVPHPTQEEFRRLPKAITKAVGAGSWRELVEKSVLAAIVAQDEAIEAIPTDNMGSGSRGGFAHRPAEAIRASQAEPAAVGNAVHAALALSRSVEDANRRAALQSGVASVQRG